MTKGGMEGVVLFEALAVEVHKGYPRERLEHVHSLRGAVAKTGGGGRWVVAKSWGGEPYGAYTAVRPRGAVLVCNRLARAEPPNVLDPR